MADNSHGLLMRYKRWATNDLNDRLASSIDRLAGGDQGLIRRVLDHIQTVDEIFSRILEGRAPAHSAPRSAEIPEFETLALRARAIADWYVGFADALLPERRDEAVDFRFTSGTPGRMTRGEMLLHVAMHGTYHRGNIGALLQKNGIEPPPDRVTDFVEIEGGPMRAPPVADRAPA